MRPDRLYAAAFLLAVVQEEKICYILDVIYRFHKDFCIWVTKLYL
jgi:hypothetical protein